MAENLKSESGVLAKASQTVDTHRAEQNAISQRVQAAAAESQSGWQGQGAAAVAQVVQQYAEDGRRIDQALLKLSDGLRSTGTALTSADSEVATGARRLGSEAASNYRNLP